jgi:hypothetical protein
MSSIPSVRLGGPWLGKLGAFWLLGGALWVASAPAPVAAQQMCTTDADCPSSLPRCAQAIPGIGICFECTTNGDCSGGKVCKHAAFANGGSCTLCGNKQVDSGEQCDDGNDNNNDACVACARARCGDGFVGPGETCDPPGRDNCSSTCQRTLYQPCDGSFCNGDELCAKVQSDISYCFKRAELGCTDQEVKVFNRVCALSCTLTSRDPICSTRGLACISRQETYDDDTDGICLP